MKLLLKIVLITGLVAFTNAQSLSDQLRDFIENFRYQMPCTDPPLAPLDIENIDVDLDVAGSIQVQGYFQNVRIDKLDTFVQEFINLNMIPLRITFTFFWEEIPITGIYSIDGSAAGQFPFNGHGNFYAIPKNVTLDGSLWLNTPNGFLNMHRFDAVLTMDDIESNFDNLISENEMTQEFLNRVLEKLILELMVLEQETISQAMSESVMAAANVVLNNMTTQDLLDMIAGGGRPFDEVDPCLPPEDLSFVH